MSIRKGVALKFGLVAVMVLAVACSPSQSSGGTNTSSPAAQPTANQVVATPVPPPVSTLPQDTTQAADTSVSSPPPTSQQAVQKDAIFQWLFEEVDTGTKPAIALSSDDVPHIAYMLEDIDGFIKSASRNGSSDWQKETIAEGYFYGPLDIGIGPDDSQQIAYHDHQDGMFRPNKGDAVLAKKSDGQWEINAIFDPGHDGWDTRIFVDSDSRAHISAIDPMEFGGIGVEYYAQDDDGTWVVEDVGSGELTYKWATSLVVDSDGVPYVTYYDQNANDLILASKQDGAWNLETVDSAGDTGLFASIAIGPDGSLHISYLTLESDSSGTVKYAVKRSSEEAWIIEEIDLLDSLEFGFIGARNITSMSVDSQGNPWIAYTDEKTVKLAFWDGSQWQIENILDAGADKLGQLISLELDSNDEPHITYFVVTSNQPLNGQIMYAKGTR